MVDREQLDGRPADRRTPNHHRAAPLKVLMPRVSPWVEQWDHLAGHGIDAGDVRTLVRVAAITAQTEVVRSGLAAVLLRDDVVDREGVKRVLFLMNQSILAATSSSLADEPAQARIHQIVETSRSSRRAVACKMAMKVPAETKASYSSRSCLDNRSSVLLEASSSTRACTDSEARSWTIR